MEILPTEFNTEDKIECKINQVHKPVLYGFTGFDYEDVENRYYYYKIPDPNLGCFEWAVRYKAPISNTVNGRTEIALCNTNKWYNGSISIIFEQNIAYIYNNHNKYDRTLVLTQSKTNILYTNHFLTYWVKWNNGVLLVGEEGIDTEFMRYQYDNLDNFTWIGLLSEPEGGEYVIRPPQCGVADDMDLIIMECY